MRGIILSLALAAVLVGGMSAESGAADNSLSATTLVKKDQPWVGDLDVMIAHRTIRALVVYSKTFYFMDGAQQRGLPYDLLKEFETFVNRKFNTGALKIHVIIIPVARDELLPALTAGRGDLAVANLTITAARRREVDFSAPFLQSVSEIVVSGQGARPIAKLEDLAGLEVEVRRSSSYYESLLENNIHAGVRYLRHIHDVYLANEPMDPLNKTLFAFAAYNAGPSRVMQFRREAARQGLDPNRWFHNVENIAAKRVGRETVQYVGNIYKYYIAYRLVTEKIEHKNTAIESKGAS